MSTEDQANQLSPEDAAIEAAAREALETKARMLGVSFHPSLSDAKLNERIKEHIAKEAAPKTTELAKPEAKEESIGGAAPVKASGKESETERRMRLKREASKLVRVIISCKNPLKKEHGGQFFSVGNSVVGTFTKYVPFENQEGWHVPQIILTQIQNAQYQYFYSDQKNPDIRLSKRVKEFVVEILPPLTKEELHDLAQRQAMGNTIDG